jgi:hypothetical protein
MWAAMLAVIGLAGGGARLTAQTPDAWLEVPELQLHVEANEAVALKAGRVSYLNVHLRRQPQDVAYAKVTTLVNAEVANIVATQTATTEGIVCNLNLTRNPELALHPGRNSVEVIYTDRWNAPHYTSFMLQMPGGGAPKMQRVSGAPYAGGQRYALVVGVGKYKFAGRGIENLAYADSDAAAFREFVTKAHGGNVPSEHVEYLLNENATLSNVRAAFGRLVAQARPQDTVLVYLNLHGAYDTTDPDHKYLMLYDSDPNDMAGTALAVKELPSLITNEQGSKHIVVLADTCHAKAVGGEASVKARPDNLVNLYLARALGSLGQAAVEASDVHQLSHEGAQWKDAGVFTHYVIAGLGGAADANGDGTVTAQELFAYVQSHVSDDTFDEQLPVGSMGAAGNVALAGIATGSRSRAAE